MARRSRGGLRARAVLAAAGILTAAMAVPSPTAEVAHRDLHGVADAAAVQPAGAAGNRAVIRAPAAASRRHATTQPTGERRIAPTTVVLQPRGPAVATPARSIITALTARSADAASSPSSGPHSAASTAYHGSNHVWIPSLGISRTVQSFPCTRSRPPDAGIYRWGCAGRNNVYLMSHAWSTFKPLHDAYVRGRLRKGMKVWYADGASRVHQFSVIWWRVTAPTTAASWAWAAQSRPSMTLQTCVGVRSQNRLMVRLVLVG